jgi:hypothetical protein
MPLTDPDDIESQMGALQSDADHVERRQHHLGDERNADRAAALRRRIAAIDVHV